MLYITEKEFRSMESFNPYIKIKDNYLYKMLRNLDGFMLEYFHYLVNMPKIDGLIKPNDLIKDDSIYGYQMDYIPNSQNLTEYLQNPKFYIDRIQAMRDIFNTLNEIHKSIIIGDVRNANFLLTEDKTYFIDIDEGKKISSPGALRAYYDIICDGKFVRNRFASDAIKAFVSALSIYYGIDIELHFVRRNDIKDLYSLLKEIKANPIFLYYLDYLITLSKQRASKVELDFASLTSYIDLPTTTEVAKLCRMVK